MFPNKQLNRSSRQEKKRFKNYINSNINRHYSLKRKMKDWYRLFKHMKKCNYFPQFFERRTNVHLKEKYDHFHKKDISSNYTVKTKPIFELLSEVQDLFCFFYKNEADFDFNNSMKKV
jgi:hypothetical protein